jgi:two-component system sensor histidine kinase QseC
MPLIDALNRLLRRIGATLASERRFTADAAHELRTPLAAIRANTQVLMKARDEDERQRTAQDLLASVDRGSHLVDQLLALARVDRSGAIQRFADIDLSGLVAEQVQSHLSTAAARGITLRSDTVPVRMPGDPTLLTVMIRNLIDNSLRYGREGGTVTVTTRSLPHANELVVEDDGPGIPEEEREKVFERFHRVAGTGSTGSGLGLSIVQRVASLHDGTAMVDPPRGDRGTRIRVRFAQQSSSRA